MKKGVLKEYEIYGSWRATGKMTIVARSQEEAEEIAMSDAPLPTDWDYLDDSFALDKDVPGYGEYQILDEDPIVD